MERTVAVSLLAVAMLLASLSFLLTLSNRASAYTPHAPIVINGNGDFTAANGVTGGSGTWDDPHIIEGYWIYVPSDANWIVIG